MIHTVFSSFRSFKTLTLGSGLNILLSEKTAGATAQQTRNRTGKSSLVELIHFLLGSNCDADSTFRSPELVEASFGIDVDVIGEAVRVSRSAAEPSKVIVERGAATNWHKQPTTERDTQRRVISNSAWKSVLGRAFFGINEEADTEESEGAATRPTFRSLLSYFVRRETNGGMREPTRNSAMQQKGDEQIAISFLIGIDWTIAQQWESVRQKEKQIRELKRIVGQGMLKDVLESAASLRSRLVVADEKLRRVLSALSSFRVHEQYHELEREASTITRELGDLSDENHLDRTYMEELEAAMRAEMPPAPEDLVHLYEEAGVTLPELVRQRYEDVISFHESVIRNRRSYLEVEHAAAQERVRARELRRLNLDLRRSELMSMLKSYGALEEFVALQAEHGRLQAEAETLRQRFEAATRLESTSSSLEADRVRLLERLRQEFGERSEVLDDAIRIFSDIVEELYGEPGQLEFHATHNGPELRIAIKGDRSRGIGNMEVFCFDMMLQRLCAQQTVGPGFLVHDSHLFDGVDPRQTGRALAVGARLANEIGFQYLVTLNSDVLSELPADLRLDQYILPERLTDARNDGGLFGIPFEPPRRDRTDEGARPRKRRSRAATAS